MSAGENRACEYRSITFETRVSLEVEEDESIDFQEVPDALVKLVCEKSA